MTDPGMAHRTYVGPMTPDQLEQIIQKEKPDAILPTMGGQTALNLAKGLAEVSPELGFRVRFRVQVRPRAGGGERCAAIISQKRKAVVLHNASLPRCGATLPQVCAAAPRTAG